MTREELLAEVNRRWSTWATTATTDDPPSDLFADLVAQMNEATPRDDRS